MKKKKQSKKRWAWTESQKRKHRNGFWWGRHSAPNWYCRTFHKSEKIKTKNQLRKVMEGVDPDELQLWKKSKHNHIATGWWW